MAGTVDITKKVSPAEIQEDIRALSRQLQEACEQMGQRGQVLEDKLNVLRGQLRTPPNESAIRQDQMQKDLASFRSMMSSYFGPGRPMLTIAIHEGGQAAVQPEVVLVENNGARAFAIRPLGAALLQGAEDSAEKRSVEAQGSALTAAAGTPPQRLLELHKRFLLRAVGESPGSRLSPPGLSDGSRMDSPDPDVILGG